MRILVANLGSTSLKWRLFRFADGGEELLHKGGFERVADYPRAIDDCLAALRRGGAIETEADVDAVGFKTIIARGVDGCVRLTDPVLAAMEAYNGLAPAHNPPYITGIRLFARRMPRTPLFGLFETAFYQWAPEAAKRYAVPDDWHQRGVRRWGFHGASHKYIAERSAQLLGRDDVARRARNLYLDGGTTPVRTPDLRVISCHLGGSSSVTGILNGVGVGNSLGMSPQSGLPHNNRVGDLDPFALGYVMRSAGLSLDQAETALCQASGLMGLSGGDNDIRDIESRAAEGNARARLALDVLIHEARRWIGGYYLQLNAIDALVFTAGIGENDPLVRDGICRNLDQLGLLLDPALNQSARGRETVISAPESRVRVLVIPANEELVVAREVKRQLDAAA
ncbi:MAG: acetate kinase [Verrucomicrobia bacterium]|nr:acetate kinase [Verrucomicrobiota bacterium]